MSNKYVAALFVRPDSVYKSMPYVDCYDIERDARQFLGGYTLHGLALRFGVNPSTVKRAVYRVLKLGHSRLR